MKQTTGDLLLNVHFRSHQENDSVQSSFNNKCTDPIYSKASEKKKKLCATKSSSDDSLMQTDYTALKWRLSSFIALLKSRDSASEANDGFSQTLLFTDNKIVYFQFLAPLGIYIK